MLNKKYYVIYKEVGYSPDRQASEVFTIVENRKVAEDWCKNNHNYYFIERKCE